MNYLLLANPSDWTGYKPTDFDKKVRVCYEIHSKNEKYLSKAILGEKALLLITGKERVIKFEAVVSSFPRMNDNNKQEVEFTYVREIKPIKIDMLKAHPEINEILFTRTGKLKQNSVFAVENQIYCGIINILSSNLSKYYGDEESRKFFEESIKKIYSNDEKIRQGHQIWEFLLRDFNKCEDNHFDNQNNSNFEELVKIKSLTQLKSDSKNKEYKNNQENTQNSDELRELKGSLRGYERERLCENIEIESIAFYKSYHNNNFKYGIYFKLKAFTEYIISTEELLNRGGHPNLDYKTVRDICFEAVLQHERFHYLTELFITFEELASNNSQLYKGYRKVYSNTFGTDNCLAEALANHFSKMWFIYKDKKKYVGDLNTMFSLQAPGYRLAKDINETNEIDIFNEFEEQLRLSTIRNNSLNASVMFKEVSEFYLKGKLPLAQLEINSKINIPIYIINDGMETRDFNRLLKVVFPRI